MSAIRLVSIIYSKYYTNNAYLGSAVGIWSVRQLALLQARRLLESPLPYHHNYKA
jgi:hypothetical protein